MPNSPLACLNTYAGEAVAASCEMPLFATPESVAAAMSYVSAQLSLLSDFTDHARKARSGEPLAIVNLRRSIEGDRFGLVAQLLTARDGCIPNDCLALASLHEDEGKNSSPGGALLTVLVAAVEVPANVGPAGAAPGDYATTA